MEDAAPTTRWPPYVAALPCQSIICTFEQCFSGGMVDDLAGDGRVIATARRTGTSYSWAMGPDYIYDTFVYHWTSRRRLGDADRRAGRRRHQQRRHRLDARGVPLRRGPRRRGRDAAVQQHARPPSATRSTCIGNLEGVYLTLDQLTIDDDDARRLARRRRRRDRVRRDHRADRRPAQPRPDGRPGRGRHPRDRLAVRRRCTAGAATGATSPPAARPANAQPVRLPRRDRRPRRRAARADPGRQRDARHPAADPGRRGAVLRRRRHRASTTSSATATASPIPARPSASPCASRTTATATRRRSRRALQSGGYFTPTAPRTLVGALPVGSGADVPGFAVQIAPECPAIYTGPLGLELAGPDAVRWPRRPSLRLGRPLVRRRGTGPRLDARRGRATPRPSACGNGPTRSGPPTARRAAGPARGRPHRGPRPPLLRDRQRRPSAAPPARPTSTAARTTLLSPAFNVAGATSATLSYWRWYTNNLGNNPGQDYLDRGRDRRRRELGPPGAHHWRARTPGPQHTFDLGAVVPLTGTRPLPLRRRRPARGLAGRGRGRRHHRVDRPPDRRLPSPRARAPWCRAWACCRPNPVGSPVGPQLTGSPRPDPVRIDLYDVAGRRVRTLLQETRVARASTR